LILLSRIWRSQNWKLVDDRRTHLAVLDAGPVGLAGGKGSARTADGSKV
jgi:hypothetical protein